MSSSLGCQLCSLSPLPEGRKPRPPLKERPLKPVSPCPLPPCGGSCPRSVFVIRVVRVSCRFGRSNVGRGVTSRAAFRGHRWILRLVSVEGGMKITKIRLDGLYKCVHFYDGCLGSSHIASSLVDCNTNSVNRFSLGCDSFGLGCNFPGLGIDRR